MNQDGRTRPVWARTCTLGDTSNFSGFQWVASLQLRKLGRAGVEEDVAVLWPLTLQISSERYVVRPRQKRRERRFPEACRPGLANASPKRFEVYQNPRRWGRGNVEVLPIPM